MRDPIDLPHCAAHHEGEYLLPEQIASDPRFPDLDFFDEMSEVYGLGRTFELWGRALPIWRELYAKPGPFAQSDLDALGGAA